MLHKIPVQVLLHNPDLEYVAGVMVQEEGGCYARGSTSMHTNQVLLLLHTQGRRPSRIMQRVVAGCGYVVGRPRLSGRREGCCIYRHCPARTLRYVAHTDDVAREADSQHIKPTRSRSQARM